MIEGKFHHHNCLYLLEYLFIIFTVLSNSVYFYQIQFHFFKTIISMGWQILLIFLCIESLIRSNELYNIHLFRFVIIFLFVSLSILFLYYIYSPYSFHYIMGFSIDPVLLIIYFYCESEKKKLNLHLFYIFEQIMFFLAIISLFCYFIYCLGIKPGSGFEVNWGGIASQNISIYYPGYLYMDFVPSGNYTFMGMKTLRNTSIFVEAPVYSYFLYVALMINLFLEKNKKIFNYKLIILLLAILSTLSTSGMILTLLSIFVYLMLHYKNILIKTITIFSAPLFIYIIEMLFSDKKNTSVDSINSLVNTSYYVRHDDMLACIHAWYNHLIIGNGIDNTAPIYKYINPIRLLENGNLGLTADFFELLSFGGIILVLLYIIPTLLSFYISPNVFCFAIFCFAIFMVESVMLDKIYIIILSFLVSGYLWVKYKKNG